jgi:galactokinase
LSEPPFLVRAPGRVCLFGEHSDYLGLDVIAAAIDMEIAIVAEPRTDNEVHISYSDLGEEDMFSLVSDVAYRNRRDYFRSAFNVMARRGIRPLHGWNLQVRGTIPIGAGLSSSSAMTVGAVIAIAKMADRKLTETDVALIAYDAEVAEFGESGGTMDHFASAFGGIIHVDMSLGKVTRLPARLASIVIGDSCEKKRDTVGDLQFIRTTVEKEYESISLEIDSFNRRTTPVNAIIGQSNHFPTKERIMAEATLRNRDLTTRALRILSKKNPEPEEIGRMLTEHHAILRNELDRSTPKIERMIKVAFEAGALGCKINGSGGGGTMMAYCSKYEREIASAIEQAGGKAYIVKVSPGASLTSIKV